MSNRMDQLFKDKLADHVITPSADAWGRVKMGLVRKNSKLLLSRLAAAILLLSALTAIMIWSSDGNSTLRSTTISKKEEAKPETTENREIPQPIVAQQPIAEQPVTRRAIPAVPVVIEPETENLNSEKKKEIKSIELTPEVLLPTPVTGNLLTATNAVEKPIVLEYRLESVIAPSVATAPESKEKSGFKKVIDFAIEAKHSDGPVGLRQVKDELFALNFIKDKQKNHK